LLNGTKTVVPSLPEVSTGVVAHPARWDVGADPIQLLREADHAVELRWVRHPGGRSSLLRRDRLRILVAATEARKGDLDGNLARHLAALEQARAQGCQLAVFPELSLTGSVDPRAHPERALEVEAEPVRALLAATWRTGVAAVFGIAERAGPAFHIAQLYGHDGRLGGVYRKRHLGEGEEGYQPGEGSGVFQLGAVRFGITLCAEGEVDFPWTEAVVGGASVILFCSAPGLYGRRTDERGWRDGHAWWLSAGLGDAVRHARRLGVPVAMATQAGSTEDEDFPGVAALVSPAGEVARLPDWRPGSLVAEVAADPTVHPIREAVRCLLVDQDWRALLVRYADERAVASWWGAPGGGWTRARTTWPRSAGSCARSWPAMISRSAPGSAGAATPSGWAGG
jgi:predicted amidohydrolase